VRRVAAARGGSAPTRHRLREPADIEQERRQERQQAAKAAQLG